MTVNYKRHSGMPSTASDVDILAAEVQRRFVESGEWDRIQTILSSKLNESGWVDDIKNQTKEHARNVEPLSFQGLLDTFLPQARTSVPPAIKREVMALIRQYVEKQFA